MGPFIQELALRGNGRLLETSKFLALDMTQYTANNPTTGELTLQAPVNFVWVVYEIDLVPHDVNNYLTLTGANIDGSATIYAQGQPIATAFLVTDSDPLVFTLVNNISSAIGMTARYVEMTTEKYRSIVTPGYHGQGAGWYKQLASADQFPAHTQHGGGGSQI